MACPKPFINLVHRIARLKFAYKYQHWVDEWLSVLFTDEKTIQCYSNGRCLVKRRANERYEPNNLATKEVQTSTKINLFGGISFNSINQICPASTKLTGDGCLKIIRDSFESALIRDALKFQCDNARIHNKAKSYLKEKRISVLNYPPKSPDLNPIEHIWGRLQILVNEKLQRIVVSNEKELLQLVQTCWDSIPRQHIENTIKTMPVRLKEVIERKGLQTRF